MCIRARVRQTTPDYAEHRLSTSADAADGCLRYDVIVSDTKIAVAEPDAGTPPTRSQRLLVATACTLIAAAFIIWRHTVQPTAFDIDHLWHAARAALQGREPYDVVGPGREYEWAWPLLYPMTAVVLAIPVALLPDAVASTLLTSLSIGLLAYLLTREGYGRLPILVSACMMDAARAGQNSPLLTAAMLSPSLFWLTAAKPNIGLVMCAATESKRALIIALAGGVFLVAISFLLNPDWVVQWRTSLQTTWHMRTPVLSFGGPLLLLALLRWRRPEARFLVAFACVPHSQALYDLLPLGLTARTFRESLTFSCLSVVAVVLYAQYTQNDPTRAATILNLTMYLPCLIAVLLRHNEGAPPAWLSVLLEWRDRRRLRASPIAQH